MNSYTPHQARYFAEQITLHRSESSIEGLASTMIGAKIDLKPHQVDAALFALKSPLSTGVLLADEVGLGKTIEAGLVLAESWSERKRHILLIVPATLRMQWRAELNEKFFVDSEIMDSKAFNRARKNGDLNPFDMKDKVVICTLEFAAAKDTEVHQIAWDLVIIDEAHKLRNVYQKDKVRANKIKAALKGRKKLLLTATPLQNSLMELYGLTSIIDEHIFGDAKTFKSVYVKASNSELTHHNLRDRLKNVCKRTLRRDVMEYVQFTKRFSITQYYESTPDEQELYDGITAYLQEPKLFALPDGQRNLITIVLRKLLASSSFAIQGTLQSLIRRLESLSRGISKELELDDYDAFSEYEEDEDFGELDDSVAINQLQSNKAAIEQEIARLQRLSDLALRITSNSKGEHLLEALEKGFSRLPELGAQKKAVIFTESRRTQMYVHDLLSKNGFEGKIVFLDGENKDDTSRAIYEAWRERHKSDGMISGVKEADVRAAIVEEFRDRASILIGTEAASEGINLQFCSIVVNYDLPWNPQRIEQRIGRCHRYGQKNDVVVINFVNTSNAADQRVYELLSKKYQLFDGVFGASDEILGSVESGIAFEKRIIEIYRKCKTQEEIQQAFDALQEEYAEPITAKMKATRQSVIENFDENVSQHLAECQQNSVASLGQFSQWMYYFFLIHANGRAVRLSNKRLQMTDEDGNIATYNLDWRSAEENGDHFLRREDSFFRKWLDEAVKVDLPSVNIQFDITNETDRHFAFFAGHVGLRGVLSIDKLVYEGIGSQERLVPTYVTEDGTDLDKQLINQMLQLSGTIVDGSPVESEELITRRVRNVGEEKKRVSEENNRHYLSECAKLNAFFDDVQKSLERAANEILTQINEKEQALHMLNPADIPLQEVLNRQQEISRLQERWRKMQTERFDQMDMLRNQNARAQEQIRRKLEGKSSTEHIMTIGFEIV